MQEAFPGRLRWLPDGLWADLIVDLALLEQLGLCDAGLFEDVDGETGWTGALITTVGLAAAVA